MAKKIMTIEEAQNDHSKWLELRNKGIGGSDAGIIAGESSFKKPYELWLGKTGQIGIPDVYKKYSKQSAPTRVFTIKVA